MAFFPAVRPQKNFLDFDFLVNNTLVPTSLPASIKYNITSIHFNPEVNFDNIKFAGLNKIKNFEIPRGNINSINAYFSGCSSFNGSTSFYQANRFVDNFYNLDYTFNGCSNLTTIPSGMVDGINIQNINGLNSTFNGCSNLTRIPEIIQQIFQDSSKNRYYSYTFNGCSNLSLAGYSLNIYTNYIYNLFTNIDRLYYTNINIYGNFNRIYRLIDKSTFNDNWTLVDININSSENLNCYQMIYMYNSTNNANFKTLNINMYASINDIRNMIYINTAEGYAYASINFYNKINATMFEGSSQYMLSCGGQGYSNLCYNFIGNNIFYGSTIANFYRACAYSGHYSGHYYGRFAQVKTDKHSSSSALLIDIPYGVYNTVEMYLNAEPTNYPGNSGLYYSNIVVYLPNTVTNARNMFRDCIFPCGNMQIYCGSPIFFSQQSGVFDLFGNIVNWSYFRNSPMRRKLNIYMYAYCNGYTARSYLQSALAYCFGTDGNANYDPFAFGTYASTSVSINYSNNCFWEYNITANPENGIIYYNYNFKYGTGAEINNNGLVRAYIYYNNAAPIVNNFPLYHY